MNFEQTFFAGPVFLGAAFLRLATIFDFRRVCSQY
jgi:hypothetical protein